MVGVPLVRLLANGNRKFGVDSLLGGWMGLIGDPSQLLYDASEQPLSSESSSKSESLSGSAWGRLACNE